MEKDNSEVSPQQNQEVKKKKERILLVGPSPYLATAYGNVARFLGNILGEEYEVIMYAETYIGNATKFGNFIILSRALPVIGQPIPGHIQLKQCLLRYKPDLLFTIGDLTVLKLLIEEEKKTKHLAYFPVDGYPFRPIEVELAKFLDYKAVPSRFSQIVLEKYHNIESTYIPHHVDTVFQPLNKYSCREIFSSPVDSKDTFIFGYCGNNTLRKQIPRLLEAFSREFSKDRETILWLNCLKYDNTGWNLPGIIETLGIENQVFFTPWIDYFSPTPKDLNTIFNCWDVHVLPSSGEGFGMPIAESMACGVPQIATNYSACPEVVGTGGLLARVESLYLDNFGSNKALVDIDDLAKQMRKLRDDAKLRRKLSRNALKEVKKYHPSIISSIWKDYIKAIFTLK